MNAGRWRRCHPAQHDPSAARTQDTAPRADPRPPRRRWLAASDINNLDSDVFWQGLLLGNPHFPWTGTERFYQVQLTIPGTMNVEGATLYGLPLVAIGFTSTMAWSHTVSTAFRFTPYQLKLVPGHPTEYVLAGRKVAMTRQAVTVQSRSPGGALRPAHRTLWSSRWGPMFVGGLVPWTATSAFAEHDANAASLRFLSHLLATEQARSAAPGIFGASHLPSLSGSGSAAPMASARPDSPPVT
jgi:Penicillin amidase